MKVQIPIDEFYTLPITSGTIQNVGNTDIEITDTQEKDTGIIVEPWEKFSFHDTQLYVCAKRGYQVKAYIAVVPFEKSAGRWDLKQIDDMSEFMQGINKLANAKQVKAELGIEGMTTAELADGTSTADKEISPKLLVEYVSGVINSLINNAPAALDTLNELAAALGDDENFAATMTTELSKKLGKNETAVNAAKVNNLTVKTAVPANAVFTDTTYSPATTRDDGLMSASDKVKLSTLETNRQHDYRQPSTTYAVGNISYHSALPTGWYLECTTAGTTSAEEITPSSTIKVGETVSDGTVVWTVNAQQNVLHQVWGQKGDFNQLTQEGFYFLGNADNAPFFDTNGRWGCITLVGRNSAGVSYSYFTQLAIQANIANLPFTIWGRATAGKSWSPWQQLITESGWNASAAMHNSIYRGNDLTSYWNSGQMSTDIANGKFDDIYIGDFITKTINLPAITYTDKAGTEKTQAAQTFANAKFYIAGINSHLKAGDGRGTTVNHVVLISANALQRNVSMNPTNDTTGGYIGSDMWRIHMPNWSAAIKAAFGESHVLKYRDYLSNAISDTAPSGAGLGWLGSVTNWAAVDVEVNIPNEPMVYGTKAYSSSAADIGTWPQQLPLFTYKQYVAGDDRSWFWLRAVASASYFAHAHGYGYAGAAGASYSDANGGIRPVFLLR